MTEPIRTEPHSFETIQLLKQSALATHGEDSSPPSEMSRRKMLGVLSGASAALAVGLAGCERKPRRTIISRISGPEYQAPGKALYYSSAWTDGPYPYGLTIKTVDGRPIKVDGNPDHPVNLGASTAAMQASILSLYDPDRLQSPQKGGKQISWQDADRQVVDALKNASSAVLLTRSTLGPSERTLVEKFREACDSVQHFVHETVHDGPRRTAWKKIYGADGEVVPRFDRAKVIVSLECDFLGTEEPAVENIRTFAQGRMLDDATHRDASMSRLYVCEGAMTLTGSNADHRIPIRPSVLDPLASALGEAVNGNRSALDKLAVKHHLSGLLLGKLADDLASHRGEALVVAGSHLPESVHGAVALLNDQLDAAGKTLVWNPTPASLPVSSPEEIETALTDGVDVLICLGVNPDYDWPGGGFAGLIEKAKLSVGQGLYADETVAACDLSLPTSHNLESWNDAAGRGQAASLCQPVIAPLFDTRQEAESLLAWTKGLAPTDDPITKFQEWHDYLQDQWQQQGTTWEEALRTGGRFDTSEESFPSLDREQAESLASQQTTTDQGYELAIFPHHAVYDGRFANNGWLQELPCPVSKLVWANACSMSPKTAKSLGVAESDLVKLSVGSQTVELPVLVQPGMAEGVLATTLGHGRTIGGGICQEAGGTNVAPLLGQSDPATPRLAFGVKAEKAAGSQKLVRTQKEFSMHDRPIVLDGTLEEYREEIDFVKHKRHLPEEADLYTPHDYSKGHKWAMAIDLGACVGCTGCITACQAENNIPIVGRDQCDLGREMHWIRLDRYEDGDPENPQVHQQPMLCQHCDNAPCESVCPVNATVHGPEGLNEMVYNRCVGTRYCANNCPYKVRRFNFYRYQEEQINAPIQELVFNPQVTVRGVGVMEKCTFCVQRINAAKFDAANAGEAVRDGDVQTACQQACPSQAIQFGDLNDPESRIAKLREAGRAFHVLEELNVKPNVTYLAQVRNPNPDVESAKEKTNGGHS